MSAVKLFEVGQVLRYDSGKTALFQVAKIYPGYGGAVARYYGEHCLGGAHGAYHEQCSAASPADLVQWKKSAVQYHLRGEK